MHSVSDEAYYEDEIIKIMENVLKASALCDLEEESYFLLSAWQDKLLELYKKKILFAKVAK